MSDKVEGVCLVGSIPLQDSASVFDLVCKTLGEHLRRIPDGETGERSNWIAWQLQVFENTPQLEILSAPDREGYASRPQASIRRGFSAADVVLPKLGYADAALDSYQIFAAAKTAGQISQDIRFQVSLPTPLAPIHFYVAPGDQAALEVVYETKMLAEMASILDAIPAAELAIQWDTAVEFGLLEGVFPTYLEHVEQEIISKLVRLGNAVPGDVELGYHLCYGDAGHKHFVEPKDTTKLVGVANQVVAQIGRAVNWIHMPVPRQRDDNAYFAPLAHLALDNTELYLGLVHSTDGIEGAEKRIRQAEKVVEKFGIATECGFGRRPPESVPELLRIHSQIAAPLKHNL